jgi:Copper binding periplasmic protein CusF
MAMTIARILSAGATAALIVLSSAVSAQDALKEAHTGVITGINRLNDTIAIKRTQNGTVGANTGGASEQFKVQKGLSLEDMHAEEKVIFSATTGSDGTRTVTSLKKQ